MEEAGRLEAIHRELERNLEMIESQVIELESFKSGIDSLSKSKVDNILTSLGKGVYTKSKLLNKEEMLVEVGAGVVLIKSAAETINVINSQIVRLKEARIHIINELQNKHEEINMLINSIQEMKDI